MSRTSKAARQGAHGGGTSPIEWTAAGISAALIAAALGYMVWYGVAHPKGPPQFAVRALEIQHTAGGWLVRFEARNDGETPAAAPQVVGRLTDGGREVETRRAELDYLPQHSRRHGGLLFEHDPHAGRMALEVEGYAEP